MKKLLTKIALVVAGISGVANAQQDPQFTQFMYNKLIFNPGYAGTSGAICGVAQYRKQWLGFNEAPTSMAVSADMRLPGMPIGVGINVINDNIGAMTTNYMRLAGALNLTKIAGGTLGIGIDAGFLQTSINNNWIAPEPLRDDPSIPGTGAFLPGTNIPVFNNPALNRTKFDLGFGAYYQIPGKFYAGLSMSHLTAALLEDRNFPTVRFQSTRHIYFTTGYTFQLNSWSKLTPNVLYKTDFSATSVDLNLTYLWSDMIWVGGTYRIDDAPAFMAGYTQKFGNENSMNFKIGGSWDMAPKKLSTYAKGTFELLAGVCYTPPVKKPTTIEVPRFLLD